MKPYVRCMASRGHLAMREKNDLSSIPDPQHPCQVQDLLQNGIAPLVAHAEKHKRKEILAMIKSLRDVSFDSGASLGDGRREFCLTLFRHGIPTVYRWGLEAHASRDHTLESPLWEGYHESRRCSRNTHPESYIPKYTSVQRLPLTPFASEPPVKF